MERISLLAEVSEDLHKSMQQYLDEHPGWDQGQVFSAALSLFLLQNGHRDAAVSQVYLGTVLREVA